MINKLYSSKSDQCCEYFNLNVLSQVQRCVECEKKRKCIMDIQKKKNVCRAYRVNEHTNL